ncbi:MAG: TetR/AcrR family transcriptional regulator [Propionibacteriaceae bacterium]|nr:TetR/AcrR family transcriptional regulator [Propionibacteriaceae bacterium]
MKSSRKTRYTEMVLREALVEALAVKPITQVTVTELCARADISRGTFYLHYANPAELLEHVEDDFLATVMAPLQGTPCEDEQTFAETVLRTLADQPELASLALQPGSTLVERFFALQREQSLQMCRRRFPDLNDTELEYVNHFKEQGTVAVIRTWVQGGMTESGEDIAVLLTRLT